MTETMDQPFDHDATYPSLKGKTVFVTGGATGIGAAIVEHFCAQHAKVAFLDIAEADAHKLVHAIAERGHEAPLFQRCDLRDIEELRAAIAGAAKRLGPIAVLVNNAANDDRHTTEQVSVEYWENRMAINLRHQFFAAQAVRAQMREAGGGSIVNLGSIIWLMGNGDCPVYVAAKAGVTGLTRALAREFGPENIRVNCVMPGWVMTERQKKLWLTPEGERRIDERQCLKDRLQPSDIARMVLFLAADDSRMCTSQNFIVDAGWV
jgi:NAD(P)-dependent dehydrogenase (short-subunit alcohol dehydrogenase family)